MNSNAVNKESQSSAIQLGLAPMEGVTDWIMRDSLTRLGGIDFCVTEFLRVTKTLHPKKIFYRHCPELLNQSKTASGTPVYLQLLGGDPIPMAENAQRASELGAAGIDLNFGCPAKKVNQHDGGAILLKSPKRLYEIANSVRQSVPSHIPVSGKIRLGYEDTQLLVENVLALQESKVNWITIHCRTKTQGYKPPAHWEYITQVKELLTTPIIANGDINSLSSFNSCKTMTGVQSYMIGRAALSDPFLFKKIKNSNSNSSSVFSQAENSNNPNLYNNSTTDPSHLIDYEWRKIETLLTNFYLFCEQSINCYYATSRTKQWLKYLNLKHPSSVELFNKIKFYKDPLEFHTQMKDHFKNREPILNLREINDSIRGL